MSKAQGNCFYLPNEIFELGLSSSAFLVYSYLQRCANGKTRQCYPSYETIGKVVGRGGVSARPAGVPDGAGVAVQSVDSPVVRRAALLAGGSGGHKKLGDGHTFPGAGETARVHRLGGGVQLRRSGMSLNGDGVVQDPGRRRRGNGGDDHPEDQGDGQKCR